MGSVDWLEVHGKHISPISSLFPDRGKFRESKDWLRTLHAELFPGGVEPAAKREAANRRGHGDFSAALTRILRRHCRRGVVHEQLLSRRVP